MIRNNIGKSPLKTHCAFKSECCVFVSPAKEDAQVTITLENGAGVLLGVVYKGKETKISGIYVRENQVLKVEVEGGGDVFISVLEENTTLRAGVHCGSVEYEGDGEKIKYALPQEILDLSLIKVFVEGQLVREYELNGEEITFKQAAQSWLLRFL